MQLDALRELANIGSGNAGTALSSMLGRPVDISVPDGRARCRSPRPSTPPATPERCVTGVVLAVVGDLDAIVLLLFARADAATLCGCSASSPARRVGDSALGEIGNILGTYYINALAR